MPDERSDFSVSGRNGGAYGVGFFWVFFGGWGLLGLGVWGSRGFWGFRGVGGLGV